MQSSCLSPVSLELTEPVELGEMLGETQNIGVSYFLKSSVEFYMNEISSD